jgi:hypothetical protein
MTDGFADRIHPLEHRHWLQYGTWHRVPHIQAVLPNYDWVLYADTDYLIKDITRPLESFLHEFEFYGKSADIFLPRDGQQDKNLGGLYTFSAFSLLIKQSPFANTLLQNWLEFAAGLCLAGNYESNKTMYSWTDSDQPGLWYALTKTHMQFFPNYNNKTRALHFNLTHLYTCNNTTGLIESDHHRRTFGPEMNQYFKAVGSVMGNYGNQLEKVPDKQPIVWSQNSNESRNGLGLQMTFGGQVDTWPLAFAIHKKSDWPADMVRELNICKTRHGCYARYNAADKLEIGCHNVSFPVVQ